MGMFAFCFYDKKTGDALLCRDRFGIKPFVYVNNGPRLYFCSEAKGLRPTPLFNNDVALIAGVEVQTTVSPRVGGDYLARASDYARQRGIDDFTYIKVGTGVGAALGPLALSKATDDPRRPDLSRPVRQGHAAWHRRADGLHDGADAVGAAPRRVPARHRRRRVSSAEHARRR